VALGPYETGIDGARREDIDALFGSLEDAMAKSEEQVKN